jgi:hypothetical protein
VERHKGESIVQKHILDKEGIFANIELKICYCCKAIIELKICYCCKAISVDIMKPCCFARELGAGVANFFRQHKVQWIKIAETRTTILKTIAEALKTKAPKTTAS